MVEKEQFSSMSPREKVEKYIGLRRENTVLPKDDVNLPHELYWSRVGRKQIEIVFGNNEALLQMEELLQDTNVSEYLKLQLMDQFGLEIIQGFTRWDEDWQEKELKESLGISLKDNAYGIFDSDPKIALRAESGYYYRYLPFLEAMCNPDEIRKWGLELYRKVREMQ